MGTNSGTKLPTKRVVDFARSMGYYCLVDAARELAVDYADLLGAVQRGKKAKAGPAFEVKQIDGYRWDWLNVARDRDFILAEVRKTIDSRAKRLASLQKQPATAAAPNSTITTMTSHELVRDAMAIVASGFAPIKAAIREEILAAMKCIEGRMDSLERNILGQRESILNARGDISAVSKKTVSDRQLAAIVKQVVGALLAGEGEGPEEVEGSPANGA